jgi:alpha-1,6-mannosyltransferase
MDENLRVYLTRSPWGGTFARWYTKWIYFGFFDHHIVNSQHTAEELRIAARGHITERGIWVRTPGVDLQDFTGITPDPNWRTNHNVPAHAAVILYVGRLAPEKNLDLLFDACDLLGSQQPFHLVIVGDGIERPRLEQRLPSSRNVTFLGHLTNRAALAQTYRNADVFVHPNPNEPFGIAPLEAMASGLAFVGPRSGGVLTYANDDNAWLADPHPAAFAQAILKALSPDRHQRLRAARETARHYESRATANRFLELYKEFVDRGTTASADYVSTPGTRWGIEHLGSP